MPHLFSSLRLKRAYAFVIVVPIVLLGIPPEAFAQEEYLEQTDVQIDSASFDSSIRGPVDLPVAPDTIAGLESQLDAVQWGSEEQVPAADRSRIFAEIPEPGVRQGVGLDEDEDRSAIGGLQAYPFTVPYHPSPVLRGQVMGWYVRDYDFPGVYYWHLSGYGRVAPLGLVSLRGVVRTGGAGPTTGVLEMRGTNGYLRLRLTGPGPFASHEIATSFDYSVVRSTGGMFMGGVPETGNIHLMTEPSPEGSQEGPFHLQFSQLVYDRYMPPPRRPYPVNNEDDLIAPMDGTL